MITRNVRGVVIALFGTIMFVSFGVLYATPMTRFPSLVFHQEGSGAKEFTEEMLSADLEKLALVKQDFTDVRAFFVDLAVQDGAVYAFEVLKRAPVPPNTDVHLLGHAVGDELYKQQGLDGMEYCTHDLRNACSHSVVIGALLAEGPSVFDKVNAVCKKAPGGSGAYTMCFHGFGHGVLAYAEYEIPQAVQLCGKVGTDSYGREEEAQCVGGIVMEMFQGIHDPEVWAQKKEKYLSVEDPLRMCEASYMPENAKVLCYSYITPFIFEAAGALNGNPTPDIYKKSFAYCDLVQNDRQRQSCYGGLGKEFIVLAQDRDIRRIEDTQDSTLELTASWCMRAERNEAQTACITSILDSLFWGGENDPEVSIRYCSLLADGEPKNACFNHLFQITAYYQKDPTVRKNICARVPGSYRESCETVLF
jgi:hypothetical protein